MRFLACLLLILGLSMASTATQAASFDELDASMIAGRLDEARPMWEEMKSQVGSEGFPSSKHRDYGKILEILELGQNVLTVAEKTTDANRLNEAFQAFVDSWQRMGGDLTASAAIIEHANKTMARVNAGYQSAFAEIAEGRRSGSEGAAGEQGQADTPGLDFDALEDLIVAGQLDEARALWDEMGRGTGTPDFPYADFNRYRGVFDILVAARGVLEAADDPAGVDRVVLDIRYGQHTRTWNETVPKLRLNARLAGFLNETRDRAEEGYKRALASEAAAVEERAAEEKARADARAEAEAAEAKAADAKAAAAAAEAEAAEKRARAEAQAEAEAAESKAAEEAVAAAAKDEAQAKMMAELEDLLVAGRLEEARGLWEDLEREGFHPASREKGDRLSEALQFLERSAEVDQALMAYDDTEATWNPLYFAHGSLSSRWNQMSKDFPFGAALVTHLRATKQELTARYKEVSGQRKERRAVERKAREERERKEAEEAERRRVEAEARRKEQEARARQAREDRLNAISDAAVDLGYRGLNREAGIGWFLVGVLRGQPLEAGLRQVFWTELDDTNRQLDDFFRLGQVVDGFQIFEFSESTNQERYDFTIAVPDDGDLTLEGQRLKDGFYAYEGNLEFTTVLGVARSIQVFRRLELAIE